MIINTSKKWGGKFYVYFDNDTKKKSKLKKDDYLEFETGGYIQIIIDPERLNDIYVANYDSKVISRREKEYKFKFLNSEVIGENFMKDDSFIPSVFALGINTSYYEIYFNKKFIKKGNILGD